MVPFINLSVTLLSGWQYGNLVDYVPNELATDDNFSLCTPLLRAKQTQPHEFSFSLCSTFSFLFHSWSGVVSPEERDQREKLSSAGNSRDTPSAKLPPT